MTVRKLAATAKHQMFYSSVMAAALENRLSDAETIAILAVIVGQMVGAADPGLDQETLRDTALYNITQGAGDIKGLIEALGKAH